MKNDTFANRLKKAMNLRSITQIDLATKTSIDKSLINKYLKNIAEAGNDNLSKLAETLNVSEVWLMGYDVPMEYSNKQEKEEKYKQILKEKGLMDENDYINEEQLNKLLKIADMVKDLQQNNKE